MYYEDKNGNLHPVRNMRQWALATRLCAEAFANGTAVFQHQDGAYEYANERQQSPAIQ